MKTGFIKCLGAALLLALMLSCGKTHSYRDNPVGTPSPVTIETTTTGLLSLDNGITEAIISIAPVSRPSTIGTKGGLTDA